MIVSDEKIYKLSSGQTGEAFEKAVISLTKEKQPLRDKEFGTLIPLEMMLVNKDKALSTILKTAQLYWGNIDLFLFEILKETTIDLESANERLHKFFSSSQGKDAIYHYLIIHNKIQFENLFGLIFGREMAISKPIGGLHTIYLYKIGTKYFVHFIFNQSEPFWRMLFIKKVCSIFLQASINKIDSPIDLMKQLKIQWEKQFSPSKAVLLLNKLMAQIEYENPHSFHLKELQLFNITSHFNGGRRHRQKLKRLVEGVWQSWEKGQWSLTEKEKTILTYMLAIDAYEQCDFNQTILHGEYLIQQDRLNNHAIELIIEFYDVLPILKPEPTTLIKRYDKNYLEKVFSILIDSYIQKHQFDEVIRLIKEYEIASCTAIYDYLNQELYDENSLHRIEASVQRDIVLIVSKTPQHIMQSIEIWLDDYQNEKSPFYPIALMASKHICNLLKALFATEQYDLFDKLMEVYTKYLKVEQHFLELRDFVAEYVKS